MDADGVPWDIAGHSTSEIIKVIVGEGRKVYNLHHSLLSQKSPFFDKCLNNAFKEGKTREVKLENEDIAAFDQFVMWIYGQEITAVASCLLVETYKLADKFCMEAFKNDVMDQVQGLSDGMILETFDLEYITELYESGHSNSPLTSYLLDHFAFNFVDDKGKGFIDDEESSKIFHTFLGDRDLMKRFFETVFRMQELFTHSCNERVHNPATQGGCKYHEHTQTEPCNSPGVPWKCI